MSDLEAEEEQQYGGEDDSLEIYVDLITEEDGDVWTMYKNAQIAIHDFEMEENFPEFKEEFKPFQTVIKELYVAFLTKNVPTLEQRKLIDNINEGRAELRLNKEPGAAHQLLKDYVELFISLKETKLEDVKEKPQPDFKNMSSEELLDFGLRDRLISMFRTESIPASAFLVDDRDVIAFCKRTLFPVLRKFNQEFGLEDPIDTDNILQQDVIKSLDLSKNDTKTLLKLRSRKRKILEQFYGGSERDKEQKKLEETITQVLEKYPGKLSTEDVEQLELRDVNMAMSFMREAFLLPLSELRMRTDDLFVNDGEKLMLKSKWNITVPPGGILDWIMRHLDVYKPKGKENELLLELNKYNQQFKKQKQVKVGKKKKPRKKREPREMEISGFKEMDPEFRPKDEPDDSADEFYVSRTKKTKQKPGVKKYKHKKPKKEEPQFADFLARMGPAAKQKRKRRKESDVMKGFKPVDDKWPGRTGKTPEKRWVAKEAPEATLWFDKYIKPFVNSVEDWVRAHREQFDEYMKSEDGQKRMILEIWKPRFQATGANFKSLIVKSKKGFLQIGKGNAQYAARKLFGLATKDKKLWETDAVMQSVLKLLPKAEAFEKEFQDLDMELFTLRTQIERRGHEMRHSEYISSNKRIEELQKQLGKTPKKYVPFRSADPPEYMKPEPESSREPTPEPPKKPPTPPPTPEPSRSPTPESRAPSPESRAPSPESAADYESEEDEKMPHIEHMDHHVEIMPVAHVETEEAEWQKFFNLNHSLVMRNIIQQNKHTHFVQYNSITEKIEPINRYTARFRKKREIGARRGARYEEIHHLRPHPLLKQPDEIDAVSRLVDPLHDTKGQASRLGSYIQLKVLPNVLNICIKRGVQMKALILLSAKILDQNQTNYTHIQIKRKRNGKHAFKALYSSKQLSTFSAEMLAEQLMKLLKGKKYIHLIAKPNTAMYNSFEEKHILK